MELVKVLIRHFSFVVSGLTIGFNLARIIEEKMREKYDL